MYNHCVSDSIVLGRPLIAQQAWDVLAVAKALAERSDVDAGRIAVSGFGSSGTLATLAGALSDRFAAVAAVRSAGSFLRTIEDPVREPYWLFAPNILTAADVPQLIGLQAPRPFLAANPTSFGRKTMSQQAAATVLEPARSIYAVSGAAGALSVAVSDDEAGAAGAFLQKALKP